MELTVQPVDSSLFRSLADSFQGMPTFERAEMSVSLAKSYTAAYTAYCAAVTAGRSTGSVHVPSVAGGSVVRTCGSPCRRLGSPAMTGSGYWSVPSGLSLDASKINSDGRCYLSMAAVGSRTALYRKLGPWPTLARLLSAPSGRFCRDAMDSVSMVRVSDGTWHVAGSALGEPADSGGVSALKMLARVVEDYSSELGVELPRWDGTLLRDLQLEVAPRGGLDVPALGDKIGGTFAPGPRRWSSGGLGSGPPFTVYLGGARSRLSVGGWRTVVLDALAGSPGFRFLYPGGPGIDLFDRGMMGGADALVVYFGPGPAAPSALVELGLCAHSPRLVVCCDPGATDRQLVVDVCMPRGVKVFDSLDDVVGVLESWGRELPSPRPSRYSPVACVGGQVVGPCVLPWDEVDGTPEVSVYQRGSSLGRVTVASYRSTRKVVPGLRYAFRVPGESGSVYLKRSVGLCLDAPDDEVAGRYVLSCGRTYEFAVSYALDVFALTFEYHAGSCGFGEKVLGCPSVGGLDDPPGRSGFGLPAGGSFAGLFRPEYLPAAAAVLGSAPSLRSVLSFPVEWYVESEELEGFSLYPVGGSWVFGDRGSAVSLGVLAAVCQKWSSVFPVLESVRGSGAGSTEFPCPELCDVVV